MPVNDTARSFRLDLKSCSSGLARLTMCTIGQLARHRPDTVARATPETARSRSLGDLTDAGGGRREIAYRLGAQRDS